VGCLQVSDHPHDNYDDITLVPLIEDEMLGCALGIAKIGEGFSDALVPTSSGWLQAVECL